jgi:wyosine [tRNA(Phe)-imidazoG37] synthetase (radical SAM superfamily)
MRARTLDFVDHRRDLGDNRYVYAVVSRRARGLSIGLNLNPDKSCNFDCPYCQVDRTAPGGPRAIDVAVLGDELGELLALVESGELWHTHPFDTTVPALRRVADIAFAGDGEPTSPPAFPAVAAMVHALRDDLAPGVPIRLLTNATLLHRPLVHDALVHIDEVWAKLDAGTEAWFQRVDGTTLPFRRILDNLRDLARERPIVVQSMFHGFDGGSIPEGEGAAWAARLGEIVRAGGRIDRVQVYTVARRPSDPRITPLPTAALEAIAAPARALGLTVEVHGPA